jgi:hypothetical protein
MYHTYMYRNLSRYRQRKNVPHLHVQESLQVQAKKKWTTPTVHVQESLQVQAKKKWTTPTVQESLQVRAKIKWTTPTVQESLQVQVKKKCTTPTCKGISPGTGREKMYHTYSMYMYRNLSRYKQRKNGPHLHVQV